MIAQVFLFKGKGIQMEIEAGNYPIAVMGAGTMGRGIAQVVAYGGNHNFISIPVTFFLNRR